MSVRIENSPIIRDRRDFAALCNFYELWQAWEIGVDRGEFAACFMRSWRGETLHLVDPYEPYPEMPWQRDTARQIAAARMIEYADRVKFFHLRSPEVIASIPPRWKINFVYIDGAHDYESVSRDVNAWWARLAPVGVLAGHDWCDEHPGVRRAVMELAAATGQTIFITREGNTNPSWYMHK